MAKKKTKSIKITQVKSIIGAKKPQKLTMDALGLRRMNQSVVKEDNPQIRGMVQKVIHLVKVEEA